MNQKLKANICLLGTAIIWGLAFVVQKAGMDSLGPFMFTGVRVLMGAAALWPLVLLEKRKRKDIPMEEKRLECHTALVGGIIAGIVDCIAANLQQVGLVSVDAGKTAFITALYILLVPIIGIFLKNKANILNWIGAVMGTVGLYFLCITERMTIERGDLIVLIGALFWALHILTIDHFTPSTNAVSLIFVQCVVVGVLSVGIGLFTETNSFAGIWAVMPNLIYSGVFSSAFAFTLQAMGQKHANPTTASIILSTESLFGAICGFLFMHEVMSGREIVGCVLMMAAIVISQLPMPERKK